MLMIFLCYSLKVKSGEKEPGIWNNSITKKMKINRKTIHYHIKKLSDLGLIYSEKSGSKKKLYLKSASDYFNSNN